MCGITGIFNFNFEQNIDHNRLKRMTDSIRHRGPDGEGFYVDNNIGLGHRRLSIIDLQSGDQPMWNKQKSIVLVLNGEIYNYIELRNELVKLGHNFITNSDTEVVIKSYEEWGVKCQEKFNGMWAFALWDANREQLFISRDRIGEKPLFYSIYNNSLIFGSEIKAIFEYGVPRDIRYDLIGIYLVLLNIPCPDTFYKSIYKLKPGNYILANRDSCNELSYWALPEIDESNMITNTQQTYDEFKYLLEDSVRIRMRCDVPFGAFLSGGLDSSSIVSIMSNLSSFPVETFTIGFPYRDFDESSMALETANLYKTNHHVGTVQPDAIEELLNICFTHFDEPFGDSSAIPTWQVSSFAGKRVKMVLTGDGGDEVLSGYNSYAGVKLSEYIFRMPFNLKMFSQLMRLFAMPIKGSNRYKVNKIANIIEMASVPFAQRMYLKSCQIPLRDIKMLVSSVNTEEYLDDFFGKFFNRGKANSDFYKLTNLHFKHYLPDDYLVKVDRMSMANSIETRAPFLDYRLIEFMIKVDKNVKMQGWERKSVLRNTIGKQLPSSILKSSKRGFGVPLREWFKDPEYLQNIKLNKVETILNKEIVRQTISDNALGKRNNGNFIWSLMMLEKFL